MRQRTVTQEQWYVLISWCLSKFDEQQVNNYDKTIYLVSQLKHGIGLTIKYHKQLGFPVTKITPIYSTTMVSKVVNHYVR